MDFFDIITNYPAPTGQKDFFDIYLQYFKNLLKNAVPKEVYDLGPNPTAKDLHRAYQEFETLIPIISRCDSDHAPCTLSVTTIAPAHFTWGVGRFAADILNRWLIPGKLLTLLTSQGLNFAFRHYNHFNYYCHNVAVKITDQQELQLVKENFPKLIEEMRLVIKATIHTRRIISTASLPMEQKQTFIQEYITTLTGGPNKEFDRFIFDQVHNVFICASAEHNIARINSNFAKLAQKSPLIVDRNIFTEIQHFVLLFRDGFMSLRSQYHLYRIMSYMYIFRKWITHQIKQHPHDRYMPVKLLLSKIDNKPVLGLIIGMNVLVENEVFEARHILASIRAHLPQVEEVKDSYVIDNRKGIDVLIHYLEVKKQDGTPFTLDEVHLLKRKLVKELPSRIERRTHPLFVHRNEEEVMRNILILSRQLKYVKDIPQVIVNYAKQTASSLCFTVILVRLLKPGSKPLQQYFTSHKFIEYDVKIVGNLRRKYPKEASVFEIRIDKHPFLRHDYAINLYKARESVISELTSVLGDIRDFNGGMISKQTESLIKLKALLKKRDIVNDFLLENFFYSTTPTYMQSVIDPEHLETLFLMLQDLPDGNFDDEPYHFKTLCENGICYIAIGAPQNSYQEDVSAAIEGMQIPSSELCATTVNIYNISTLCYLYQPEDPKNIKLFVQTAQKALNKWSSKLNAKKNKPASNLLLTRGSAA